MKKLLLVVSIFLPSIFFAQVGKVGINTTIPRAMLHVKDSSVLFSGGATIPAVSGPTPVNGSGVRMLWYPDKAAFRVGEVIGNKWNRDSIGIYTFASGYNNVAFGEHSVAMGKGTKALGLSSLAMGDGAVATAQYDMAIGKGTLANGGFSTALGFNAKASGGFAVALGDNTTAAGESSTAMGFSTVAASIYSTAMGAYTTASAFHTTAMGAYTKARGRYSSAMGLNTWSHGHAGLTIGMFNDTLVAPQEAYTNDTPLFIIGNGDDADHRSNAMVVQKDGFTGVGTNAPQNRLHVKAPSNNTQISRFSSTGGYGEIVVDNSTHEVDLGITDTWGYAGTKTNTDFSLRTGTVPRMVFKYATGNVGIGTINPDTKLHVHIADDNVNLGKFSCMNGYGQIVIDNSISELALGVWENFGFAGTQDQSDFAFRTDALERMRIQHTTGNVGIGTTAPSYKLEVNGSAAKPGGGSWVASSDARLKQNVVEFTDGLSSLLHIRPVTYQYNTLSGYDTNQNHIGVIAQELKDVAPYMVSTSAKVAADSNADYLEVDNSAMTYMLINAVKEQQTMISQLQHEISQLYNTVYELQAVNKTN